MKAYNPSIWMTFLWIALLLGLPACGQPEVVEFVDLTLSLEPRVVPEDTTKIYYYILPNVFEDGSGGEVSLECSTFMGTDAVSVFDYSAYFVRRDDEEVDPLSRIDIPIFDLPVGRHIFYLEALGDGNDPLACGCNQGMIEAGQKTQIRIRMILDCL